MKISFECADKINGLLTMTIEPADYQEKVEKKLKDYRKRAQVPGFRPGNAPMGLIKKQYGAAVKVDEVNQLMGKALYDYIHENKIQMLGDPMPSKDKQVPQDLNSDGDLTFVFDIAVAPEFKAELTADDHIPFYTIEVSDDLIDRQIEMLRNQNGEMTEAESYAGGNDTINGDLRQLDAEGNTLEGGITVDSALVMPSYIKDEEQKKIFDGCKPGDILTFNPRKAYQNDSELAGLLKLDKEQVADITSDFSFQVKTINHYQAAELNQALFDKVLGEGTVTNEQDFRKKIAEEIASSLSGNSKLRFLIDLRKHMEEKIGELQFPEALLKRIMQETSKDKDKEVDDKEFENTIKALKWHLIKEQLAAAQQIQVTDDEVRQTAESDIRAQFAQYGMGNVPDELVEKYAQEQMQKEEYRNRCVDRSVDYKLTDALLKVVTLDQKTISLDEFNKMMEEK